MAHEILPALPPSLSAFKSHWLLVAHVPCILFNLNTCAPAGLSTSSIFTYLTPTMCIHTHAQTYICPLYLANARMPTHPSDPRSVIISLGKLSQTSPSSKILVLSLLDNLMVPCPVEISHLPPKCIWSSDSFCHLHWTGRVVPPT